MKSFAIAASLFVVCPLLAGWQADARFDGIWVGNEILEPRGPLPPSRTGESLNEKRPAKIIIAEHGTLLAVAEGICPGRYTNIRASTNSISFGVGDCHLELTLSPDAKTLVEKGSATGRFQIINGNVHYWKRFPCRCWGHSVARNSEQRKKGFNRRRA